MDRPSTMEHEQHATHQASPGDEPHATQFSLATLKQYWPLAILALILIFAWNVRWYHHDYPVIGYHDWKETHYLTEARNFARDGYFQYGFFVPWTDYPIGPSQGGIHPDTFPLPQIINAILFKLFGFHASIARTLSIIFSVATVAVAYLLGKTLFKREETGLLAAALFAIAPLLVFFGRQAMLDPPALFLTMLGTFFFLQWRETDKPRDLILATAALTLGVMTKYTFILLAAPLLALTPWQRIKEWKPRMKTYATCAAIAALLPLWIIYMATIPGTYGLKEAATGETVDLSLFSDAGFWQTMKAYAADNYTIRGFWLALLGIAAAALTFKRNTTAKYLTLYAGAGLIWFIVMAFKLGGHNYHQYPLMPLALFAITYLAATISGTLSSMIKLPGTNVAVYAMLILLLYSPSAAAWNRQFDTQFIGLDAAGAYIKEHSAPDERVFHSGHQSYSVLWEADRKGGPLPSEVETILEREDTLNYQWYLMYQWGFQTMQNEEVWNHLKQNYHLAQAAVQQTNQGYQPLYFLFRRGGEFNDTKLNDYLANKAAQPYTYEFTGGKQELTVVNVE